MLQATADATVIRQLEALEEQLALTRKNRNCVGWGALLADDWTVTISTLKWFRSGRALKCAGHVRQSVRQLISSPFEPTPTPRS